MERKTFDFTLSKQNIQNIPFNVYENNFTFIVNGKSYQTNRFIADLLSPYVRQLHYSDKCIDTFILDNQLSVKQNPKNDYFLDFLNFVPIDEKQKSTRQIFYSEYFYLLGNTTEYDYLYHQFFDDLNEENAIDRLISLTKIQTKNEENSNLQFNKKIDQLIDFISSNFEKVNKQKLEQLNFYIIEQILSNKHLILDEEDSLLNFILELYSKSESYSPLFEYVDFENVSKELFEEFISTFEIQNINQGIWESICFRFFPSKSEKIRKKSKKYQKIIEIEYEKGHEFEGIMHYLVEKTGDNIHDNETIEISSNSIRNNPAEHPKNLVDYNKENFYHSGNDGKAKICFDFKEKLIQLSSYTIKSNHNDGPNSYNLKNWVIEVSNDGYNWEIIDKRDNNSVLNGRNIVFNFDVQEKNNVFYRFVRLRQTGDSWSSSINPNFFWFYYIEFFGKLKDKNKNKNK